MNQTRVEPDASPPDAGDAPARAGSRDLARRLVDWCQLWDVCGHTACRRARGCRVAGVPCFEAHIDTILALLDEDPAFVLLLEAAEERLARGDA